MEYYWGIFFMQKSNYLIKRKDRNYYTYQSKFNIPVSLQNHFGKKSFKISLKSDKCNQKRKDVLMLFHTLLTGKNES